MRDKIKNTANYLIKKYGTRNPEELADYLNILITTEPLGKTWGAYLYAKRNKIILINSDLEHYERKLVLAHEIGHAVLHTKCKSFRCNNMRTVTKPTEIEANHFAAHLLINDKILKNYPGETLEYISLMEEIPLELLKLKASYYKQLAQF